MKMLKRMESEAVEVDYDDPYLRLDFPSASYLPPPCISVIDAAFGYVGCPLLYGARHIATSPPPRAAARAPRHSPRAAPETATRGA